MHPDASISVRAPLRTPLKDIRAFVIRKGSWVGKILAKLAVRPQTEQQGYEDGAIFLFQGERLRLTFVDGSKLSLVRQDDLLLLTTPTLLSIAQIRKVVDYWYREQALAIFRERSIACHGLMQAEAIPLPPITIRAMITRWGSYSYRTRRISLNLNLIRTPPACLDYVIIHELCHIKVRHHGPAFWEMVARYVPDYLAVRSLLRQ